MFIVMLKITLNCDQLAFKQLRINAQWFNLGKNHSSHHSQHVFSSQNDKMTLCDPNNIWNSVHQKALCCWLYLKKQPICIVILKLGLIFVLPWLKQRTFLTPLLLSPCFLVFCMLLFSFHTFLSFIPFFVCSSAFFQTPPFFVDSFLGLSFF